MTGVVEKGKPAAGAISSVAEQLGPTCPAQLGPVAREEWDRIVGELVKLDCLTQLDRIPLAIYSHAFEQWIEAVEAIRQFGAMIKSPNGFPVQSPYVAQANRAIETMMKIAAEYGFTPASRKRIFPPEYKSYSYDLDGRKIEI